MRYITRLVLILMLIVMANSDIAYAANDECRHEFEIIDSDANYHEKCCSICNLDLIEKHSYNEEGKCICEYPEHVHYISKYLYNGNEHWGECELCGLSIKSESHCFNEESQCVCGAHICNEIGYVYSETGHRYACSICKAVPDSGVEETEHNFDEERKCVCGYFEHEHSFSSYEVDINTHDGFCEQCGLYIEISHTYDEEAKCICGKERLQGIYLAGKVLTEGDYLDLKGNISQEIPEGGYAYYSDETLILNDFAYEGADSNALIYSETKLEIKLTGTNVLINTDEVGNGIVVCGKVLITGSGELEITAKDGIKSVMGNLNIMNGDIVVNTCDMGISAKKNVVLSGGNILVIDAENAEKDAYSSYGIYCQDGGVLIGGNSNLTLRTEYGIYTDTNEIMIVDGNLDIDVNAYAVRANSSIMLADSMSILNPVKGKIAEVENESYIVDDNGQIASNVIVRTDIPMISGVENGKTYYTSQKVTVIDADLEFITVNDEVYYSFSDNNESNQKEVSFIVEGDISATYDIVVEDRSDNILKMTIYMEPIRNLAQSIFGLDESNVTSEDIQKIQSVQNSFGNLDTTYATDGELEVIISWQTNCNDLLSRIQKATDARRVDNIKDITIDNVKRQDKEILMEAKATLENALTIYDGNYTDAEKEEIQNNIIQIDEILTVIVQVEEVEEKISSLKDIEEMTLDDKEKVVEARQAYEALFDYQKTLVNVEVLKQLEKAEEKIRDLEDDLNKIVITNSKNNDWKEREKNLYTGNAKIAIVAIERENYYGEENEQPLLEGHLFAGWFEDEACTIPFTEITGEAYAKFVDEDVLKVMAQASVGIRDMESGKLRFLSTVDSANYANVGFHIEYNGKTISRELNNVYKRFYAVKADGTRKYYEPTIASPISKYFIAFTLTGIPKAAHDIPFNVTPYWTTLDGTYVEGVETPKIISSMNGY